MIVETTICNLVRYIMSPVGMAIRMKNMLANATAGELWKVLATIAAKAAMISTRTNRMNQENILPVRGLINSPAMYWMDFPPKRTEIISER